MRKEQDWLTDKRMTAAVELASDDDPEGLYLTATADIDDTDDVVDVFVDRLLDLQIDDGLPLYVIPIRTPGVLRA